MKIRVADYITQKLVQNGIQHVFMVTGGGAMHLNDAFGRTKGIQYVCCHHEQACAIAAESYYRMTNRLAAVNVTTGPGGTNAITGVYGAYVDSIGMIVISGQVKWETLVRSTQLPLRQLGDQEIDIIEMVKTVTKYAEIVTDPQSIRYHLEKALYLATQGRPGPVWLDIPMNVQGAMIDPETLKGFEPPVESPLGLKGSELTSVCESVLDRLKKAKRPVIMPGTGVRLSGGYQTFLNLVETLQIPVVTAFNAHDLLWDDHPLYVGRPGTVGDRPGNFAVQNSDFLLVLGCRLNIRQISYSWDLFAREAYKVMVDIDEAELKKPTLKIDLPVHAELSSFMQELLKLAPKQPRSEHQSYLAWCKARKEKYPVVLPEYWDLKDLVNPYCFVETLYQQLGENDLVIAGDGTATVTTFQGAYIKRGQRLYSNSGCASMGYDLPAAIGGAVGAAPKRLICMAGDGSIMMNLQELQTIATHKLPIKIFLLNNRGYHSIRQTQQNYFPDNIVGCGSESGVAFPDFSKVAAAFQIPFERCHSHSELKGSIEKTLNSSGPMICEVMLDLRQQFAPKLSSKKLPDGRMVSSPLEDLAPFLPREELLSNLLIRPIES